MGARKWIPASSRVCSHSVPLIFAPSVKRAQSLSSSPQSVPRLHIVGRRNSGKTTLVCELVEALTERDVRVATIKHTHHNHELDTPGKDSWRHREAGAVGVGILSPHILAAFVPAERSEHSEPGYDQLADFFTECDLLLVEGDLHADAIKLEVWREEVTEPPYAREDSSIQAVISDTNVDVSQDVWPRSNVVALANRIIEMIHAG